MRNIHIYSPQGDLLISTPVNTGSKAHVELMKSDYIEVRFSSDAPLFFPIGSYCLCNGEENAGIRYRYEITDLQQQPTYNKATGGYDYVIRLDAYYMKWKNKLFRFNTKGGGGEASWSMTANLATHLDKILENLSALGYTYRDSNIPFAYTISGVDKAGEAKLLTYSNTNIIDALTQIAEAWECEWWVNDNIIFIGACEDNATAIDFEIGTSCETISPSSSRNTYGTRLYAFGSTRNIPLRYRKELVFSNSGIDGNIIYDDGRKLKKAYFSDEDITSTTVEENVFHFAINSSDTHEEYYMRGDDITYNIFSCDKNGHPFNLDKTANCNITANFTITATPYSFTDDWVEYKEQQLPFKVKYTVTKAVLAARAFVRYLRNGETYYIPIGDCSIVENPESAITLDVSIDTLLLSSWENIDIVLGLSFLHSVEVSARSGIIATHEDGNLGLITANGDAVARIDAEYATAIANVRFLTGANEGRSYTCTYNATHDKDGENIITLPDGVRAAFNDKYEITNILEYKIPLSFYSSIYSDDKVLPAIFEHRLMLPNDVVHIDSEPDLTPDEIVEIVKVFEDIYPKREGIISNVTTRQYRDEEEDGEGNKTYTDWDAYVFQDSDFTFDKDWQIPNTTLQVQFQTGSLAGMIFDVIFHEQLHELNISEQCWEIVRNEEYRRPLPDNILHPKNEDKYILLGFNVAALTDAEYIHIAEKELQEEAEKFMAKLRIDPNTYNCTLFSDFAYGINNGVLDSSKAPLLPLGRRIRIINDAYFKEGQRFSRIVGWDKKLDILYDSPQYIVGESLAYSRLSKIEDDIQVLTVLGQQTSMQGGDTEGVYLIKRNDIVSPSDYNTYSSARAREEFVNKSGDTIDGDLNIVGNLEVENAIIKKGLDASGAIIRGKSDLYEKALLRKGLQIGESFVGGLTGSGGIIDNEGRAELESLVLRSFLEVPELRYNRTTVETGTSWRAPGGGIIEKVEITSENTGIIYLHLEEGEIGAVAVNDICQGIYHSEDNMKNAHEDSDDGEGYMEYAGFATVYFAIQSVEDWQKQNEDGSTSVYPNGKVTYRLRGLNEGARQLYHPAPFMNFVCYGNFEDTNRQKSVYATRTYERYLFGVNNWSFSEANIAMQLGDLSNLHINGTDMKGYSAYLNNIYMSGTIQQIDAMPIKIQKDISTTFLGESDSPVTMTCQLTKGDFFEELTAQVTSWAIMRSTGNTAGDNEWNNTRGNQFSGNQFTFQYSDLADSTIPTVFTIKAVYNGKEYTETLVMRQTPKGEKGEDGKSFEFNLLDGTAKWEGAWENTAYWADTDEVYNGCKVKRSTRQWSGLYQPHEVQAGQQYTFSAWVRTENGGRAGIYANGGTATLSPNSKTGVPYSEWTRISLTFTVQTSGMANIRIENSVTSGYVYTAGYKLERGSETTEWAPSVNDMYGKNGSSFAGNIEYYQWGMSDTDYPTGTWSEDIPQRPVITGVNMIVGREKSEIVSGALYKMAADGRVQVSGTANGASSFELISTSLNTGKYTISFLGTFSNIVLYYRIGNSGYQTNSSNALNNLTITIPEDNTSFYLGIKRGDNGIVSLDGYFQLQTGETATLVEPSGAEEGKPNPLFRYLWNWEKTRIIDGDGNLTEQDDNAPHILTIAPEDGENGRGIENINEYYLLSDANTGITTSTPGWSVQPQRPTPEKPYLWNYEQILYDDDTESIIPPHIVGTKGEDGNSAHYMYICGISFENSASGERLKIVVDDTTLATWSGTGTFVGFIDKKTLELQAERKFHLYHYHLSTSFYYNDPDHSEAALASYLSDAPSDVFVLLATTDATYWDTGIINAMQGLGARDFSQEVKMGTYTRQPVAFIGQKGLQTGEGYLSLPNYRGVGSLNPLPSGTDYECPKAAVSVYVANGAFPTAKDGSAGRSITNIITEWGVSADDTTPPTVWSDTATMSTERPYKWMRVVYFYSDGSSLITNESCIGSLGVDGVGSYSLDLTNEMDVIGLRWEGDKMYPVDGMNSVSTELYVAGGNNNTSITSWTAAVNGDVVARSGSGSTTTIEGMLFNITGNKLTVTGLPSKARESEERFSILITASVHVTEKNQSRALSLGKVFTVGFQAPGAPGESPVVYQLKPTHSSLKKDSDGNLSVSLTSCSVIRTTADSAEPVSVSDAATLGLSVKAVVNEGIGNVERNYAIGENLQLSPNLVSLQWKLLRDNTVIDSEDVAVVQDGAKGDSGSDFTFNLLEKTDLFVWENDKPKGWGVDSRLNPSQGAGRINVSTSTLDISRASGGAQWDLTSPVVKLQANTTYILSWYVEGGTTDGVKATTLLPIWDAGGISTTKNGFCDGEETALNSNGTSVNSTSRNRFYQKLGDGLIRHTLVFTTGSADVEGQWTFRTYTNTKAQEFHFTCPKLEIDNGSHQPTTWAPAKADIQGADGRDGIDGKDAETYSIVPSVTTVRCSYNETGQATYAPDGTFTLKILQHKGATIQDITSTISNLGITLYKRPIGVNNWSSVSSATQSFSTHPEGYSAGTEFKIMHGGIDIATVSVPIVYDGRTAISSFISWVFFRTTATLDHNNTPTGGSYASPTPTTHNLGGTNEWQDSIPSGTAPLWATYNTFKSDGKDIGWKTPLKMTSTANLNIMYCVQEDYGGVLPPDAIWTTTPSENAIWMAVRTITDGVASAWSINKIKGEKGVDGYGFAFNLLDNSSFNKRTDGSNADGWTKAGGGVFGTSEVYSPNSEYTATITASNTDILKANITLKANTPYVFSWYSRHGVDGNNGTARLLPIFNGANINTGIQGYIDGKPHIFNNNGYADSGNADVIRFRQKWSDGFIRHSVAFTSGSTDRNATLLIRLYKDSTNPKCSFTCPKLEVDSGSHLASPWTVSANDIKGESGLDGATYRTSDWVRGKQYLDGSTWTGNIRFVDVCYGSDNKPYICIKTHNSNDHNLGAAGYWQEMSDTAPIHTKLILAENAVINFGQANQLLVQGTGGAIKAGMCGTADADKPVLFAGSNVENTTTAPFRVYQDGKMCATGAEITGNIKCESLSFTSYESDSSQNATSGSMVVARNGTSYTLPELAEGEMRSVKYLGVTCASSYLAAIFSGATPNVLLYEQDTNSNGNWKICDASSASHCRYLYLGLFMGEWIGVGGMEPLHRGNWHDGQWAGDDDNRYINTSRPTTCWFFVRYAKP